MKSDNVYEELQRAMSLVDYTMAVLGHRMAVLYRRARRLRDLMEELEQIERDMPDVGPERAYARIMRVREQFRYPPK